MLRFIDLGVNSVCAFKDDIQNGHQNFNFLIIHLKQLKLRYRYVGLLRSNWKKHKKALNSACSIFLLSEPKIVTKIAYFIQIFAAQPNGQTKYFVIRFLQNKGLGIISFSQILF